ncbi:MAG TPA: hypothetical protein VMH34_05575 [Gammaproteobacteria bacterium]|nr:hypothetical protein [Gammaproteobacteria bacterium]
MTVLFAIQIFHTIITIVIFFCLGYIIYGACTHERGPLLRICFLVVAVEAAAIAVSGFRCPLHLLVIEMTGNHHTPDILFPAWISKRIMKAGILLATAGILLHFRNQLAAGRN